MPSEDSVSYSSIEYLDDKNAYNYLELKNDKHTLDRIKYYEDLLLTNNTILNKPNYIHFLTDALLYSKDDEVIGQSSLEITYEIYGETIHRVYVDMDGERKIDVEVGSCFEVLADNYLDFTECNPDISIVVSDTYSRWSENPITNLNLFKPDLLIAMVYEYTNSSDIYIPTFSDLTEEEIVNEIGIEDKYGNRLMPIDIVYSTYVSRSNVAYYKIKVRSFNKEKHVIFKWIYVHVIDSSDIARSVNFMTAYNKKLDDLEIIDELEIKREYENINIRSEYHYCSNKNGEYRYIANIKFSDMNFLIKGVIVVIDTDKPYGTVIPELITAPNDYCMNKEEILKNFIIYDDHDGIIPSSNISINGLVNYLSSYKILNDYNLVIVAKDSSGNKYEYPFILRVTSGNSHSESARFSIPEYEKNEHNYQNNVIDDAKEENYNPIISNSNYIISAYTTHKLTTSEVQDLLISEGYLNNYDVVNIESEYFKEANPKAGTFSLSVTYQNGDITYYEINLVEKEEEVEEKSYTGLIVSLIVGGIVLVALIIIVIMRVYVHVKKN